MLPRVGWHCGPNEPVEIWLALFGSDEGEPVQVQINTGKNVEAETDVMEEELLDTLSRFSDQLIRVDVHLTDQNAEKSGADDLRCTMEAKLAGFKPVAVTHSAATVNEAYNGAAEKIARVLDTTLAKIEARRGRDTIRHPAAPQFLPDDIIE
jgi:ribosome-associated translation inhibitor RaiA